MARPARRAGRQCLPPGAARLWSALLCTATLHAGLARANDSAPEFAPLQSNAQSEAPAAVAAELRRLPAEPMGPATPRAADRRMLQAAREGRWADLMAALQQADVAANATDEAGASALALAARAGAEEAARALIRHGADLERPGERGLSPLASAVIGGHAGTVRLLVQAGADAWAPGGAPQPPLHWAARLNQLGVIDTLLALGLSPHTPNARGQDALYVAFLAQRFEALARLSAAAARRR